MICLISRILAACVTAQVLAAPAIEWVTEYGTMFYDSHETSSHQFIVVGQKYYADYARTVFLYDSDGNLVWETGISGLVNFSFSYWVEELPDNTFLAVGAGRDSIMSSVGMYLMNVSESGDLLWWKGYDFPDSSDTPHCVLPLSDGRLAICGEMNPIQPGYTNSFLMVTDASGDSLWTARLKRNYGNSARRVLEYNDQLIVFVYSSAGILILSFNADSGEMLWEASDFPDEFHLGPIGGDMTLSTVDEGFTFVTSHIPYIAHTDEFGCLQWYYELPYWSVPYGHSVNSTMDGGYIYGGENTPGWPPDGIQTGMVAKLDSEGALEWADIVWEAHDIQSIRQLSTGGYIACGGETPGTLIRYEPETGIETEPPSGVAITSLSPVPFAEQLTVNYSLDETATVDFQVFDLTGRLVHSSSEGTLPAGNHSWVWNAGGEPSGCYLVRLGTDAENCSRYCVLIE